MNFNLTSWRAITLVAAATCILTTSEASAHTSIALNGRVTVDIRADGLRVEYKLECGTRTAIDLRSRIDTNHDSVIDLDEFSKYDTILSRRLDKTKKPVLVLLDKKPITLEIEDVRLQAEPECENSVIYMIIRMRADDPIPVGMHSLVLERDFCPIDVELLGIPIRPHRGRAGGLVRVLRGTLTGHSDLRVTKVSPAPTHTPLPNKVHFVLNNLQHRAQFNFTTGSSLRNQVGIATQGTATQLEPTPIDTITSATPFTLAAPARVTEISTIDASTFDPSRKELGRIAYSLSKPASVRIRVHLRADEGIVFRTTLDWDKRLAGKNVEYWNGRDTSGRLVNHGEYPCWISIVADDPVHWRHERNKCKDLRVSLTRRNQGKDRSGESIGVSFSLDDGTRGFGDAFGYKVRCYVDYILVDAFEVPGTRWRGMEYTWNIKNLKKGEHLLTVVVDDGADHIGSNTIEHTTT